VQDPNIEQLLGGPPRISHDAVRRHPRMPQARKLFLDRFLALYADDPFLVRLLIEMSRVALYQSIIVLESAHHDARRGTWLTVGLLKQLMTRFGLASGRQIDHLVGRLCAVGFMEQRPSAHDRRVRILAPTEKLRAHDRAWLAAHHAGLTVLFPQNDYSLVTRADPCFHAHVRRAAVPFLPLAAKMMQSVPDMSLFLKRAGAREHALCVLDLQGYRTSVERQLQASSLYQTAYS
jgi:DNA-binding MarR family transcriptional regulator